MHMHMTTRHWTRLNKTYIEDHEPVGHCGLEDGHRKIGLALELLIEARFTGGNSLVCYTKHTSIE